MLLYERVKEKKRGVCVWEGSLEKKKKRKTEEICKKGLWTRQYLNNTECPAAGKKKNSKKINYLKP